MWEKRQRAAAKFAQQIVKTCTPFHSRPPSMWTVLDVGSGWGFTSFELTKLCKRVLGAEPEDSYLRYAQKYLTAPHLDFVSKGALDISSEDGPIDLIILDNVYEHLPRQRESLAHLATLLNDTGMIYILVPNRLWPIEGNDYLGASYAPTYWSLIQDLNSITSLQWQFTLPADISLSESGGSLIYRAGMNAIRHFPALWAISRAFLVVAIRRS